MIMNGAQAFVQLLQGYGVTHVFFVPAIMLKALAEMERSGIRRIMTHGEKSAAYMADGYARACLRPGVCMAQHIGASNLAAGLRDAFLAGSPVIAVTGGTDPGARYRHSYQEVEDFSQFECITKLNVSVDEVTRLPDLVRRAFREATSGTPGPAHLRVLGRQGNVAEREGEMDPFVEPRFASVPAFRAAADPQSASDAVDRLIRAQRPIIVAGGGVVWSGAQAELVALAQQLDVPVATSLNAKGAILDDHPLSVGVAGTYSRACANQAVLEADLVFFVGSHTGGQVTANWKLPAAGTPVIHLDIAPGEIGRNYPCEVELVGDARTVLAQMRDIAASAGSKPDRKRWLERVRALATEWRDAARPWLDSASSPMRPERICRDISRALPESGVVVCDTGHAGMWAAAMIDFTRPGQRLVRSAGSLGWAFPASLGVKCALPDRPVLCFTGDGGLHYHLAELETAARCGINVVVVVNNNSALNQEIALIDQAYGSIPRERSRELWGFNDVNFADVARSMGCGGMRVERPADLPDALEQAFAARKPYVVDAVSDASAFAERVRL